MQTHERSEFTPLPDVPNEGAAAMYCSNCGKAIPNPAAVVCVGCGAPTVRAHASREQWGTGGYVGLCILALLVPLAGAFVWGINKKYPARTDQSTVIGVCAIIGFVVALAVMNG